MIKHIEVLNYRCLKYISQELGNFNVLVGPNASGKTTFLDSISFLGDLLNLGLEQAITKRTTNFHDLVWLRQGSSFQIAVEVEIPEQRKMNISNQKYDRCRYEIEIGIEENTQEVAILSEKVVLIVSESIFPIQPEIFPSSRRAPNSIIIPKDKKNTKTVVNKKRGGNDNFYDETGKSWDHSFKLGNRKSAFANLPEDETKFPVSIWLKNILMEGVQNLILNSVLMRKPSPPGKPKGFRPDGSNLPWVIDNLSRKHPDHFKNWVLHLQTALPDIVNIKTYERPEDKNCYIAICYRGGLEVPSWMVSDGTLRLMALTILAYLPEFSGIYLVEEPENGIHPKAIETAFQSMSSIYNAQIILATHSPVMLNISEPEQVLCFAKTKNGATDIVRGDEHPALKEWRGEVNLGTLFAGGVLG